MINLDDFINVICLIFSATAILLLLVLFERSR